MDDDGDGPMLSDIVAAEKVNHDCGTGQFKGMGSIAMLHLHFGAVR